MEELDLLKNDLLEDTKGRYRLFSIVLYADSTSYKIDTVLFNIKACKYYAYIIHDKDKNDKGEIKKEHYHVIIKLDNATTITALANKLGIPENYIQHIKNERAYIRYLIHYDSADKYMYKLEDIHYSRCYQRKVLKSFEDVETEEDIICNINNFITNIKNVSDSPSTALFALIQYVNSNAYDTIYKRYRQEFTQLLNYHL